MVKMSLRSSKADLELKLDECIMSALDCLLRNFWATDEFMAIYQEVSGFHPAFSFTLHVTSFYFQKMFIKSNTKAFIYVTHYLFTVLNEKEVKKRFYWPIKCKADENHFR